MKKVLLLILCLIGLTACSAPRTVVKTEYIPAVVPELPAVPVYYTVQFQGSAMPGWYCLDETGAKNLLKNWEIAQSYESELLRILESLKVSGEGRGRK